MTVLTLDLKERSYDITIGSSLLSDVEKYIDLNRKVLILTDDGVPKEYSEAVEAKAKDAYIYTVKSGEESKSIDSFEKILSFMLKAGFSRGDLLISVGGGVVGDLGAFVASAYMRGI